MLRGEESRLFSPSALLAGVADAPDAAGAVVGDVEGAVVADGDADGTAPDLAVSGDEAGEEVLVLAGGLAVLHGDADELVAATVGAVPGAVLGREAVAVILRGEARRGGRRGGGVEGHAERGHVGLHEDVGGEDLVLQLRMRAGQARVLVATH